MSQLDSLLIEHEYQTIIDLVQKDKASNDVISWLKSKVEEGMHPPLNYLLSSALARRLVSSVKYNFSGSSSRDSLVAEELSEIAKYYARGKSGFQVEVAECSSLQTPKLNSWLRYNYPLQIPAETMLSRSELSRSLLKRAAVDSIGWVENFVNSDSEEAPVWLCGESNVKSDDTRFRDRKEAYDKAKMQVSKFQ